MTQIKTNAARSLFRGSCMIMAATLMVAVAPTTTQSDAESRPLYSKQEIRRAITFYAKRYRIDPALLRAVIKAESGFRQDVVSRKGAIGLMQLMPDTAAMLRVSDVRDSIQNIRGGAKQLRRLLDLYGGDLPPALAAYNAGVNRVKGHKVPRIRETRRYVRRVLSYYHRAQAKQSSTLTTKPGLQNPGRSTSVSKA